MLDFEQITIEQGKKLERIETLMGSIDGYLEKCEVRREKDVDFRLECQEKNNKSFVSNKIFYSVTTVITSVFAYLFTKG